MNKLTIMFGLPGSGKDTYIKDHHTDEVVLSSDNIRVELYGYEDQSHNKEVFDVMKQRTAEAGIQGKNVIYNATNLNRKRRKTLASEMKKYFSTIEVVAIICPIDTIFERNEVRKERHLPKDRLLEMMKGMQIPTKREYEYDNISFIYSGNHDRLEILRLNDYFNYDQHNTFHSESLGNHIVRTSAYCCQNNDNMSFIAAMYHDLAKPIVQEEDENGQYHYFGHPNISAYLFITDCANTDTDITPLMSDIALLIELHDYIFSFNNDKNKMIEKLSKKYIGLGDEFFKSLSLLMDGDRLRP